MKNKKTFYSIKEIRNNKSVSSLIPSKPGVYQWWCQKKALKEILKNLDIDFKECSRDLEKTNMLAIDNKKTKNELYYCIYVGDTKNLRRRICANHINGKVRTSTLRKTIAAVLFRKPDEKRINTYIDTLCIEWEDINSYHKEQNKRINAYFRPLNNDDISSKCIKYTEKRHYIVTRKGNSKRSYKLKQLRSELNNKC